MRTCFGINYLKKAKNAMRFQIRLGTILPLSCACKNKNGLKIMFIEHFRFILRQPHHNFHAQKSGQKNSILMKDEFKKTIPSKDEKKGFFFLLRKEVKQSSVHSSKKCCMACNFFCFFKAVCYTSRTIAELSGHNANTKESRPITGAFLRQSTAFKTKTREMK